MDQRMNDNPICIVQPRLGWPDTKLKAKATCQKPRQLLACPPNTNRTYSSDRLGREGVENKVSILGDYPKYDTLTYSHSQIEVDRAPPLAPSQIAYRAVTNGGTAVVQIMP
eukprot:1652796-Pleurochrysis_carterae.AAC.1